MDDFLKEVDIVISVCDRSGTIIYLNDKAAGTFGENGGMDLIGRNIYDCHPEPSKSRLMELMETHETHSIIKGEGKSRRLIQQTPIYKDGNFDGYIEFIIPLSTV